MVQGEAMRDKMCIGNHTRAAVVLRAVARCQQGVQKRREDRPRYQARTQRARRQQRVARRAWWQGERGGGVECGGAVCI